VVRRYSERSSPVGARFQEVDGEGVTQQNISRPPVTTTARYLNVKDDCLPELIERKPMALVKS